MRRGDGCHIVEQKGAEAEKGDRAAVCHGQVLQAHLKPEETKLARRTRFDDADSTCQMK